VYRSTLFEEWLVQGRAEGQLLADRATLLRLGKKKFGRLPTKKQHAELEAITDPTRLQALTERLLDVTTWGELLGG